MSFLSKLADEFEDLNVGSSDKRRDERGSYSSRDYPPQSGHYSSPPPPQQYGSSGSGGPPPAPAYRPPQDKPPIPGGWVPQYDHQHQRWYYVETATGSSHWEAPGRAATPSGIPGSDPRGYDSSYAGDHGGGGHGKHSEYGQGGHAGGYEHEENRNNSSMLMGAAGGLAAGASGGALLADALDDSDGEGHHVYSGSSALPLVPQGDESDRESLQEAREDYEAALDDAASSSASSSDREELEEAREEYQEEYEDYYEE
ncbi:hypothetical protein BJ170DRAFT_366021 [Xylariales sp. AK1849]|nr:hypothetical protein BJ170DRAFT_366021 [Xylariales sp. AK1849]